MSMQPSAYQQAILEWLTVGEGNGIVRARAGSGKTSTLCMMAEIVPESARSVFLAFNKSIQLELKSRLPRNIEAATFHSVCRRALAIKYPKSAMRRDWVQMNKVRNILDDMADTNQKITEVSGSIARVIGLLKANMVLPEQATNDMISDITIAFDLDIEAVDDDWITWEDFCTWTRQALTTSNEQVADCIDFDDMLYLTAVLHAPLQRYSYVFVDECQDLNRVQHILLERMVGRTGRIIAVGDDRQAIYAFRGADASSMQRLSDRFGCVTFPLSISYRCPASVVRLAQSIVPDIEARDNAPEGTVSTLDRFTIADFDKTDLVVCRNTSPIVSLAFKFVRAHKPVKVMGRDIGANLQALVKKMRASTLEELDEKVTEYANREVAKALAKKQDAKAQRIQDQCDSLIAMCEGMPENERTIYGLLARINELFTDDTNTGTRTTLATVHKAKGMEAHRVFILDPFLMPSRFARTEEAMQQEQNLRYVAITRALDTLHFVDGKNIA